MLNFQHLTKWAVAVCAVFILSSCDVIRHIKTPPPSVPHQVPNEKQKHDTVRIQVYSHGWHAGLVVPASALRRHEWTCDLALENTDYVELGWGSEQFYRTKGLNAMMVVRGLLWPTAAVMHIERFNESPYLHYPYSQLETFDLSRSEMDQLVTRLSKTFTRGKDGKLIHLGHGLKPDSSYYRSKPRYFYPQTCNVWTAKLLQAGGIPIRATTRAPKLMKEIRSSPRLVE